MIRERVYAIYQRESNHLFHLSLRIFILCPLAKGTLQSKTDLSKGETMTHILVLLLLFFSLDIYGEKANSVLLLGLECDDSYSGTLSYATHYEQREEKENNEAKTGPLKTWGIFRYGDSVYIKNLDHLLLPTPKGFSYGTLTIDEVVNNDTAEMILSDSLRETMTLDEQFEFDFDAEFHNSVTRNYSLVSAKTAVLFTNDQKKLPSSYQSGSFKNAIGTEYKRISFATPHFYTIRGYNAEVHGGATWFNASEHSSIYAHNTLRPLNNHLHSYLSRKDLNRIIIRAANKAYGNEEPFDDITKGLPWSETPINERKDCIFDFAYIKGKLTVIALVPLNGNSARSFLQPIPIDTIPQKLQKSFSLKKATPLPSVIKGSYENYFSSPNGKTTVLLQQDGIVVYDSKTGKELKREKYPNRFNKVIMAQWALGKYVSLWEKEFTTSY